MQRPARIAKNVPLAVSTLNLMLIQKNLISVLTTAIHVLLERAAEKEPAVATTVLLEHSPTQRRVATTAQVDGKESQKEKEKIERRNVLLASKVSTKMKTGNPFASHATLVHINLKQDNEDALIVQRILSQIKESSQLARIAIPLMKTPSQGKHTVRNVRQAHFWRKTTDCVTDVQVATFPRTARQNAVCVKQVTLAAV